ncbi:MAG: hypothetical protein ABIO70_36610 [Pseudomonadota bacterium]
MRLVPVLALALAACNPLAGDLPWSTPTDPTIERPGDDPPVDTGDTAEPWDISWDEACNPMSTADECFLPFPSLYYTVEAETATGVRLDYEVEDYASPDGALPVDPAMFDFADGVSPVSPILVNFGVDIDAAFLSGWGAQEATVQPGAAIALIHAETGEAIPLLTEMDQNNRDNTDYHGRHPLILRPLAPMEMGARYLVLLTDELTDSDGTPLVSPDVFVALRDGILTDDATVEGMRARYEALFATAEAAGWAREGLLLAWDFQVASSDFVLGPIRSMRAQALEAIQRDGVAYTIDSVEVDPNANVAWLVKGHFVPPDFLTEDNALERAEDGSIVLQDEWAEADFTMVIPPQGRTEGDLPLVVIGHGLFGTGEWMLDSGTAERLTQPLAAELGAVLVATNWIGMSGGDIELIISEVLTDMSHITVVTDRLVQSHINTMALVELALDDLPHAPEIGREVEAPLLDPERVYYYGISLGGIQGASQTAISPRIRRAVLAVPGSGWSHMIQRSTQFADLDTLIDLLYPDPMTQNLFLAALQSYFDFSDPSSLGTLLNDDPDYPDAEPKLVVLQEAIGDCQVPNLATDLLARTLGAAHLEVATDPVFGLATVASPSTEVALTQIRVPEDLDAYFPPDINVIPATDNGVHNDAVLTEAMFGQARHLFEEAEIAHPCEGECDPD